MEDSLDKADKVLVVFTEKYKDKATDRTGGVGVEYSMLNSDISQDIINHNKYIPILRSGSSKESIPLFMRQYIAVYMMDDSKYEEQLKEVLHSIFNKPMVSKSEIGCMPEYLID